MKIKLLKKGIKVDGKYYKGFYSSSKNRLDGNACIYIMTHERVPRDLGHELIVKNDSDIMTDYFEKDRILVPQTSDLYVDVMMLAENNK